MPRSLLIDSSGATSHTCLQCPSPFSTAWIAQTKLGAVPVVVYAAVFTLVNATYLMLCQEAVDRPQAEDVPPQMKRMMRMRSVVTQLVFSIAAVVALAAPLAGIALICLCLVVYHRPEAPKTPPTET